MNEQAIEDIKNALREMMQLLVQRGEPLSDEIKAKVTQVLEHAANRITQLREEQDNEIPPIEEIEEEQSKVANAVSPQPSVSTGAPIPHLDEAPHESSNINAFKYDPLTKRLIVKFQDKYPSQNGPVYQYEGVPANIYDVFRRGAVAPKTSGSNAWHTWKKGVTPSHGASMYALIKQGNFPYQKIR